MAAYYLQPVLPWSGPQGEDRRFRLILAGVLTVFFVIGYIVPYLPVPKLEAAWEVDFPPRFARIIADRIEPATLPTASRQPTTQIPVAASRAERQTASVSTLGAEKVATEAASRKKAARAGVLALSDSLAELRNTAPKIVAAGPGPSAVGGGAEAILRRPSTLTVDVAEGSGGIAGEIVAHRKILGTTGLQRREMSGNRGSVEGTGAFPATRGASATERRKARSEDEIQEILDRHKSAIYMIYNRELTKDPTLQGKVVVSVTIAPSGEVTECRIIYSELNATSLEEKLILLIKRIDFGAKPGIPVVTTRVPIEFLPV